ncbi:hypothetical protein PIB30_111713, partial [Stylosanthes scabra]|nr:hypothetical protein [Stylosanthes scabra]
KKERLALVGFPRNSSIMRNGSSRRDLLLNSQNFFRSIPAGAENCVHCTVDMK